MDIFNSSERIVECVRKYDTSPYSCDYELLEIGKKYTVTNVDLHSCYTMITLKEFPGKRFNSVLFEESENKQILETDKQMLETMEQRTAGIRKQTKELIEQAYLRGYKEGYSEAENDYHAKIEEDRQSSYELGLNMAWEAARKICLYVEDGGLSAEEIKKIFNGEWYITILKNFSASEAVEKLKEYKEQKKQEDTEIKVGDEVIVDERRFIVLGIDNGGFRHLWCFDNGLTYSNICTLEMKKTGRTFPEISEVLKQMRENKND